MMNGLNSGAQKNDSLADIARALKQGKTGVILLGNTATPDDFAAGLSLYLSLIKAGKDIYIVSSKRSEVNFVGADKIASKLDIPGDNLVISFPYVEGAVDRVDAKIENGKFSIVIVPNQGFPPLDPKQAEFSRSGGTVDFVVLIGVANLNSLGDLYQQNKEIFQGNEIINIDRKLGNARYGTINLVDTSFSCMSEIIFRLIQELQVEIDQDIATNLYSGILAGTNNFTSFSIKPDTLEIAAFLMKKGAKKIPVPARPQTSASMAPATSPAARVQPQAAVSRPAPAAPAGGTAGFVQSRPAGPQPVVRRTSVSQPMGQPVGSVSASPAAPGIKPQEADVPGEQAEEKSAPQDWLKPKIFSGKLMKKG